MQLGVFKAIPRLLVLPLRWLWRSLGRLGIILHTILGRIALLFWRPLRWFLLFLGRPTYRLGLAVRRSLAALWRRLGIWGLALRQTLTWAAFTLWRPLRWFLLFLGRPTYRLWLSVRRSLAALWLWLGIWGLALRRSALLLYRLIRWVLGRAWQAARWIMPLLWEELGRLGLAARRILTIVTWPVMTLVKFLWRQALWPLLVLAWDWTTLRTMVSGRALRSWWWVHQARRQARQREKLALAHSQSRPLRRLPVTLIAINLMLVVLVVHFANQSNPPAAAGSNSHPSVFTPTPTPIRLPTNTPTLTPIPITPAPTPNPLARGGSVAFVARQNGNDDIYALSVGQALRKPIRLTSHPADDRDPAWSPDGRKLAFSSRRDGNWELYLLDVGRGALARLTWHVAYDANPTWSPDGQWLAFESYRDQNMDIYIMPAHGGDLIRLTSHPAADYAPAWSPSGRHIAFISRRTGNPDIHLLPLDDARDQASINVSRSPNIAEDHPSWHPGGEYLAFTDKSGSRELAYIQPMQNNLPAGEPVSFAQGQDTAWAPNGKALLYVHHENGRHYLLASSVNGGGVAPQVYVSSLPLDAPTWNPATLPPGIPTAALQANPPLHLETVADPAANGPPYTLVALDDIQVSGPYLNDRVDNSFMALRRRIQEAAGWDFLVTLDKIWEPTDAMPLPGLGAESWNKAGRAFDIEWALNLGSRPPLEVVRETDGTKTWWRLYVRAQRQDGSQGEPLRERPWNFQARYSGNVSDYESGGRPRAGIPAGYYVDFSQLAADYGWERVPAARTWHTFFPAILFWHFEKRDGLDWEAAMLELYTAKELHQIFGGFGD